MTKEQKQEILDMQECFGTPAGQRVLAILQTRFHFTESFAMVVQSGIPEYTGMMLGKREAMLYILDKLNADPNVEVQENTQAEIPE